MCNLPTCNESLILLVCETTIVQLKNEYMKISPIIISLRSTEIELKIETKSKGNPNKLVAGFAWI